MTQFLKLSDTHLISLDQLVRIQWDDGKVTLEFIDHSISFFGDSLEYQVLFDWLNHSSLVERHYLGKILNIPSSLALSINRDLPSPTENLKQRIQDQMARYQERMEGLTSEFFSEDKFKPLHPITLNDLSEDLG